MAFAISLLFIGMTIQMVYLLLTSGVLLFVGAVDDVRNVSPRWRLVLHLATALTMCVLSGLTVNTLGELFVPGSAISVGYLAVPFTVFAVVAMVNAMNMCDGIDGHCGIQALLPFAGLALLTGAKGSAQDFQYFVALCGCLLGFLYFNMRSPWRSRAAVFLGDAGSSFLGFLLAWSLIHVSQGENAIISPVAVLWFALLLIYDTVEVVARRISRGVSPFEANREHLHDVFLLAGFSVTETVFAMGAITAVGVAVGISTAFVSVPDSLLFGAFLLFGILFLRMIFRTWGVMQFLYRSICRRRGERRGMSFEEWNEAERRSGQDRRQRRALVDHER